MIAYKKAVMKEGKEGMTNTHIFIPALYIDSLIHYNYPTTSTSKMKELRPREVNLESIQHNR